MDQSESGNDLTIRGALPNLKQEDAKRLAVYLVRGDEVIGQAPVDEYGKFQLPVARGAITKRADFQVEAVVGPAAMGKRLDPSRNLHRIPLELKEIDKAKAEFVISPDKLKVSEATLKLWWIWCRNYCVSGVVVGPDGCPVPGAQVTASSVVHASGGGYTVTPQGTVNADATGHFTICFDWCTFCWGWPCWPFWWYCWPWWWEWDILHVLEKIEARLPRTGPIGFGQVEARRVAPISQAPMLPIKQPESSHLMIGQGFTEAQRSVERLVPDQTRTELIRSKLSDARIRAIFPWWWWCCENPNLIFTAKQGPNVIVDEDPAIDTRWCFSESSSVTLVGNQETISACGQDPLPAQGFVWTRVGNTLVNTIVDGYAQGNPLAHESDGAFTGSLDIFGGFAAASAVAYYQVNAGLWAGNPSRGGTAPAGEGPPISTDLYNYAFMLHPDFTVTVEPVKMGPFTDPAHPGIPNLYATEQHRHLVPAALLPAFPPGTFMAWAYSGLKVTAPASVLAGGSVGAVRLGVAGFNSAFAAVALPANTADHLTLQIDTTPLTAAHINDLDAFESSGTPVMSTGDSVDCPAFNVGPGGYVVLNVSVRDDNGHLCQYQLVPNFGHGSIGTTIPNVRGYRTPTPFVPPPVPGPYTEPAIAHVGADTSTGKAFVGGTENITFYPAVNCCYDFRLGVSKRLTN
ncbi:MAG: carboxypeptidase-like regulatory domain-containing protein, partial [Acidobacteriota bacterium]|nr:carboxypeptidase-like regulatory domain-containing protein [Acidobacteriota bacterium]